MNSLLLLFFTLHIISSAVLFLYAINIFVHALNVKKYRNEAVASGEPFITAPIVTIQLPLFNERYVAERIIESTAAIKWPKDRLEIQVLDDSTDETLDVTKKCIQRLQADGYTISLHHRIDRTGQKGGACREAMEVASGEFIAIFDADFIPDPEFLQKVMPCFNGKETLGMVQTRWGHINPEYSLLTKAQTIAIDTHFAIEQVSRSGSNWFYNFNGTGGVWRKVCIIDAGGWQDDTITEDLDLSYRAQMKGWKFHYCTDVVNPAELPIQLTAYKSQQFRWAKGSIQTAKKLLFKVLKTEEPIAKKFQALLHLSYYSMHPLLLLNAIAFFPLLLLTKNHLDTNMASYVGFFFTFGLLLIAPLTTLYAQTLITKDWKKRITWLPWIVLFGTGLAVNNTRAVLEALIGKPSEFIRTPKLGITKLGEKRENSTYKMPLTADMFIELLLVIYLFISFVWAVKIGMWLIIPFILYYICSFGTVLWLQLWQNGRLALPHFSTKLSPVAESVE